MNRKELDALLEQTHDIHSPIPVDAAASADERLKNKPVLACRLLDDMTSLASWRGVTDYIQLELTSSHPLDGTSSIKATCPTNLPDWLPERARGRIYAEPSAMRVFDREDWTEWSRLSVWIRPHVPGMKSIVLRVQLYNDGEHKVPDIHMREGAHNVSLENDRWNHVTVEIPHLHRDCVTGVAIEYDMCGHEPDAADTLVFEAARLELQRVDCDVQEGWVPGPDRIAFSGSGYQTGQHKSAIAAGLSDSHFRVVDAATGDVVLERPIQPVSGPGEEPLQLLEFTDITREGRYRLAVGDRLTEPFDIGEDVWEASVWKVLNFFLSQRCGFEVPGKHRACHADLLLRHGDKAIVANGGWHDAADLAQGMCNTADGTTALLLLAEALAHRRPRLCRRVLEEAKWGLDYTLKVRFGDGFRSSYSSSSIWTDGIIGTADDIVSEPTDDPYTNYVSANAEAIGARVFAGSDPVYARHCLRIALDDFRLAEETWHRMNGQAPDQWANMPPVALHAVSTAAAAALCLALRAVDPDGTDPDTDAAHAWHLEAAVRHAKHLLACQQRTLTDWDVPMRGFFWQSPAHDIVWHHNHMSQSQYPLAALEALCQAAQDHADRPLWLSAIALHGAFQQETAQATAPWDMLPEGVYHVDETKEQPEKIAPLHPQLFPDPDLVPKYRDQVVQGMPLGKGWHLRRFPVWFSFRGNGNVQLSQGVSLAIAAGRTRRADLCRLAQRQLEWIVGRNPFAQSVMYGEGYDWIQQYAVQPGQTVGQLSVGIESLFDADRPYWPQVCTATYKEVWIETAVKWMWNMAYACLPARFRGVVPDAGTGGVPSPIRFTHLSFDLTQEVRPDPATGRFEVELAAGAWRVAWREQATCLDVVAGLDGKLAFPLADVGIEVITALDGTLRLHLTADAVHDVDLRLCACNLASLPEQVRLDAGTQMQLGVLPVHAGEPWLLQVTREGDEGLFACFQG